MNRRNFRKKLLSCVLCLGLAGSLPAHAVFAADAGEGGQPVTQTAAELFTSESGQADTDIFRFQGEDIPSPNAGQTETVAPGKVLPDSAKPMPPEEALPEPSKPVPPEEDPPEPSNPVPPEEEEPAIAREGLVISREEMKKAITTGQEFPVVVLLKNTDQNTSLRAVKLQLELPQGISMNAEQKTDTLDVKDLEPGMERKVKVKLIAGKLSDETPTLLMKAKVTYQYEEEGQSKSGNAEKNILLPVSGDHGNPVENPSDDGGNTSYEGYGGGGESGGSGSGVSEKKQADPMTPNIIISQFNYDKNVKAGDVFTLKLVLQNTSKWNAVENLVMSVEAGEALSVEDPSNTTYIERMKPQEAYTKEMKLKILPQGQLENAKLDISFKYEYVKKDERAQANSTEKMSIQFSQPDRFSVGEIQKEKEISANEETSISLPYVNKGKTVVYNMEARLVTEMSSEETYKFLGNVEPGTSGTMDFFATPSQAGEEQVKIAVTYEDAAGNEKTEERELKLTAVEGESELASDFPMDEEAFSEEAQVSRAGILSTKTMIPASLAVLVILIFFLRRRKRKRLQQEDKEIL